MAEVLKLDGSSIDWNNPPAPTDMVKWSNKTMYNGEVKGSLRTMCHIDRLNNLAQATFGHGLVVIQSCYNNTVAASAGTHDYDACLDVYIPGVDWYVAQRFLRANGFACWYRHPPMFGNHIHGFTLPAGGDFASHSDKVGLFVDGGISLNGHKSASSQLDDYHNHAYGLANAHAPGSDKSWFPANIEATVFDLQGYINRRKWRPNPQTPINVENVANQFKTALGLEKGKVVRTNGVGLIQNALNRLWGHSLVVDGLVGAQTIAVYRTWEQNHQGTGRPGVPDTTSMSFLANKAHYKIAS